MRLGILRNSFLLLIIYSIPSWFIICLQRMETDLYIGDDAYMTFKVARNLLQGHGFIYNIGENILGTTTPLWAAVLAVFSWILNLDPTEVFRPAGILLDLVNCTLVLFLCSLNGKYIYRGIIASLLFSLSWHMNYASTVGMETNFFIALLLISVILQNGESLGTRIASGVLASATFMTRPEGAFLLLGIGIWRLFKDRKFPWPEFITGLILVGLYLVYMFYAFGSIIPHAGYAKSIAYHRQDLQAHFALGDHIAMLTLTPLFDDMSIIGFILPYLLWSLWMYGLFLVCKEASVHFILGFFTFAVIILYSIMNPLLFEWYVVPLEISYIIGLVWAGNSILQKISSHLPLRISKSLTVLCVLTFLLIGILRYQSPSLGFILVDGPGGHRNWPSLNRDTEQWGRFALPLLGPKKREDHYVELAALINDEVNENSVIIAPEYGAFGYHTKAKMLSSIGHNNKEMLNYLPAPFEEVVPYMNNSITKEMIRVFKPDYVLSLEAFIRESLLKSPDFFKDYEIVAVRKSKVFNSKGLLLFRRKASS